MHILSIIANMLNLSSSNGFVQKIVQLLVCPHSIVVLVEFILTDIKILESIDAFDGGPQEIPISAKHFEGSIVLTLAIELTFQSTFDISHNIFRCCGYFASHFITYIIAIPCLSFCRS